jgi:nitrite reductase/ring-hydroxylating ferredoxin subunit
MEFVKVGCLSDVLEKQGKLVRVSDEEIALWRAGGKIYAINNVCPHQHFSMLHQGTLDDLHVTCPMHGWTFSLENGNPRFGNGRAKTYQVKVVGEDVFVEKPESKQ